MSVVYMQIFQHFFLLLSQLAACWIVQDIVQLRTRYQDDDPILRGIVHMQTSLAEDRETIFIWHFAKQIITHNISSSSSLTNFALFD